MMTFPIYGKIKFMLQTTNQIYTYIYIYIYIHIYIALYNHLTILWGPPSGLDATGGHVFGAILGGAVRQGTQAPGEEVDDRQLQPGTRAVVTIW